ncbi:MAG TPA: alpha/beta hydrolase [Candidatus Babeliales bacterium]|nr:alpha/beta hydrolase [Candidatus Babeliales bacterium]
MRTIKKIISIFCIISTVFVAQAQSVFILIHGTWGADCSWYVPKGDFFDALEETVCKKNSAVVSFRWSGGAGHDARVKAAQSLVKLIRTYHPSVAIYLVAHSHGGNVATLASHMLTQEEDNKHHIRALFTLGTPIMSNYFPNMNTIHYLYNLFSFEDIIQTVFGVSLREYPEHKRIANLRVYINGKEPDHAGLHHTLIGKWLPYLHQHFKQHLQDQGIVGYISEPSIVYFASDKAPEYVFDVNRTALLERDRQLSVLILDSLRNSLETGSNIPLTNL